MQSGEIIEYSYKYDEECYDALGKVCQSKIFMNITEKMEGPLFVYYELDNYY